MCKFFSCNSDGEGNVFYLNAEQRKATKDKYESPDSHTSIADYYGFIGKLEDKLNKYEFNPLTKQFTIDQLNARDDSEYVKDFLFRLDFKTIVPELIVKPIIHPFKDRKCETVTEDDIKLLIEWKSIRDSIGGSVRDSVINSVDDFVSGFAKYSIWDVVWKSVRNFVRDSVREFVWDSVWDFVREYIWDSVLNSVWAYISSFFNVEYKYDFSPCIKLWEKGLVPSYDSNDEVWRLHGFPDGKVVWEENAKIK